MEATSFLSIKDLHASVSRFYKRIHTEIVQLTCWHPLARQLCSARQTIYLFQFSFNLPSALVLRTCSRATASMHSLTRLLLLASSLFAYTAIARHSHGAHHLHRRQPAAVDGSAPSSSPFASSGNATNGTNSDFLYGVNIGGWLILESWMNQDIFKNTSAYDQWSFDTQKNVDPLPELKRHWSSWFTEQDVVQIKKWGFNA